MQRYKNKITYQIIDRLFSLKNSHKANKFIYYVYDVGQICKVVRCKYAL